MTKVVGVSHSGAVPIIPKRELLYFDQVAIIDLDWLMRLPSDTLFGGCSFRQMNLSGFGMRKFVVAGRSKEFQRGHHERAFARANLSVRLLPKSKSFS